MYSCVLLLSLTLDAVGGQRYVPAIFPRERRGKHCVGGWLDPRAVLDACENSRPLWDSIPGPSSL